MNLLGTSLSEKCIALCNLLLFLHKKGPRGGGISIFFNFSTNVNALFGKMIILMSIWDILFQKGTHANSKISHIWKVHGIFHAVIFSLN